VVYNRRFAARFIEALSLSLILVLSAHTQVSPELPNVSGELSIRLPGGGPLVYTGVVIKIFGGSPFRPRIPDVHVTTDDRGVARYEVPAGVYSMSVMDAAAIDIPVQVGQTTNFTLKVFPQAKSASFSINQSSRESSHSQGASCRARVGTYRRAGFDGCYI
jgi:hypothetical protein